MGILLLLAYISNVRTCGISHFQLPIEIIAVGKGYTLNDKWDCLHFQIALFIFNDL